MKKHILSLMIVTILVLSSCTNPQIEEPSEKLQVRIGTTLSTQTAQTWIAEELGFYEKNGLDVELKYYTTGVDAKNGFLNDEVDISNTIDVVIASEILLSDEIRILASIFQGQNKNFIVMNGSNINSSKDLVGKTIGLKRQSSVDYSLYRELFINDLSIQNVTLINVDPPFLAEALGNGSVDVIGTWWPFEYRIQKYHNDSVRIWPMHENLDSYFISYTSNEYTQQNKMIILRYIKSLIDAENYILENPTQAKEIMIRKLNINSEYLESIWSEMYLRVELPQSLLPLLEEEMRWKIENKFTPNREIPNVLDYIYFEALDEISPNKISIIR